MTVLTGTSTGIGLFLTVLTVPSFLTFLLFLSVLVSFVSSEPPFLPPSELKQSRSASPPPPGYSPLSDSFNSSDGSDRKGIKGGR